MTDADALHARALDLLVKGDTAGGITDLKAYLEQEPEDADAWLELGTAYTVIAHWIQAADALHEAVSLDPEEVESRLAYARVLVRIKKLDDAAFQLIQASKLDPPDARVRKELGLVFYDKRLYDKAARWLGEAIALDPDDARAHYALGLTHEARKDVGAAVASYREALKRDPALVDARRTLADALAGMGEFEGAVAELSEVLARAPADETIAKNREVLSLALQAMKASRLLGKTEKELEASALLTEGGFRNKGEGRFVAPMVEVRASTAADGSIESLLLVLTDPDRAARTKDDAFKVTVVAKDGHREAANYATALNLTFLREALGCPMTQASELYARLLGGEAKVEWGGATLSFDSIPRQNNPKDFLHGIRVSQKAG